MVDSKAPVPWRNTNKPQTPATREDFFDPFEVGNGKVNAKYDKGVLTVHVSKPAGGAESGAAH